MTRSRGGAVKKAHSAEAAERPLRQLALSSQPPAWSRPILSSSLEACWLALAFLTPSLFDPASVRVFEPEKIAFIRSVAILMVALWAIRRPKEVLGSEFWVLGRGRRVPFLLPVVALIGCYLLAALFSQLPGVSLLGSYRRQFGAVTYLSFGAIFLVVSTRLRSSSQARRLLLAIALGALIPSLYAALQKLGLDPIPWTVDNSRRVVGTLGQPTYLGAYLAAVLPATLWLLLQPRSIRWRLATAALLALQALALLFSQSRAAWIGAAVGLLVVLLPHARGRLAGRLGTRPLIAASAAALALLVAINLPGTPLNTLARSVPYLERLATLSDFEGGSGKVRTVIWRAVPPIVAERPILGQGPDMMGYAFERHYPPELAYAENRTASADEAHNVLLQQLVNAGILGLLAFLWLMGSVAWTALSRGERAGGAAERAGGAAGPYRAGDALTPVNMPEGMFTLSQWGRGLLGDLFRKERTLFSPSPRLPLPLSPRLLLSPIPRERARGHVHALTPALAGIAAWLVEGMAGVPSASPYLLFWLYLGLVAAMVRVGEGAWTCPVAYPRGRVGEGDRLKPRLLDGRQARWGMALVAAVALIGIARLGVMLLAADVEAARAEGLASQGRFAEALPVYRQAISLDPEAEYYLLLGQAAMQAAERAPASQVEGWLAQGEEALGQAEALNPLDLDVALAQGRLHQDRASILKQAAEWPRAEDSFRRAIALSPNRSYVHNRYGAVLAAQGKYSEAIAEYRTSLLLDPQYAASYGFLADALVATGSLSDALDAYRKGEELDPNLVLVRINLAELYLRLGRLGDAVSEYEAAVRLAPDDQQLRERLTELRRAAP